MPASSGYSGSHLPHRYHRSARPGPDHDPGRRTRGQHPDPGWPTLDRARIPILLLEQTLGLRLPVTGLRYWVRGLPAPGPTALLQTDAAGRLTRLEQNGWVIEYPSYAPSSVFNPRPARAHRRPATGSRRQAGDRAMDAVTLDFAAPAPAKLNLSSASSAGARMVITCCRRYFSFWTAVTGYGSNRAPMVRSPAMVKSSTYRRRPI